MIRSPAIAILYGDPIDGDRARILFDPILCQRLARFGGALNFVLKSVEDERRHRAQPSTFVAREADGYSGCVHHRSRRP
jgi:hypothetical protein